MKLKQTIGIVLISIYLLSITAIAAPEDNMETNTDEPVADPTFMADFTATHDMETNTDEPVADPTFMADSTVTRDMGTNTDEYVADENFKADFIATHEPNKPLTVRFTEKCIGEPVPYRWGTKYGEMTYFWGFGDKTTSILKEPVHPFKKPGKYKVYLRIQNAEGKVSRATKVINVEW